MANTKKASSLKQEQKKQKMILISVGICVALLLGYIIFGTSDPEEEQYNKLKDQISSMHEKNMQNISYSKRKYDNSQSKAAKEEVLKEYQQKAKENRKRMREMREELKKLKPKVRKKLVRLMLKSRLDEARKQTEHLSAEEKKEIVDRMVKRARSRHNSMSESDKAKRKEKMQSKEEKERIKEGMDFYMNEMTAKERELLDPLVKETLKNLGEL